MYLLLQTKMYYTNNVTNFYYQRLNITFYNIIYFILENV